jgi:hypothetical protein
MFELILFGIDLLIVVTVIFNIIKGMFGENPKGRALAIIGAIITIIGYLELWDYANYYANSMLLGAIVIFGPIGLAILIFILEYILKGNTNEQKKTDTNEQSDN